MLATRNKLLINGAQVDGDATGQLYQGGIGVFTACASAWNGATATLQYLGPDGTTWIAAGTNTTLTANGNGVAYLPTCHVRASVSGGTPTGLYAVLDRMPE